MGGHGWLWGLPRGLPLPELVLGRLGEPVLAARGLREPLAGHKASSAANRLES